MKSGRSEYLLQSGPELERLRLQAVVWEPDAQRLFDAIGVGEGWRCVDVGCGAMGVLRPLSRAAGARGEVVGVDRDESLLRAAEDFVETHALTNVRVQRDDVFDSALPAESFDLVHMRFMLAPIGRFDELLRAALRLCRPGGIVVLQEPDASCWSALSPTPAFDALRDAILQAFAANGGDFNAGRRTYAMLQQAGLGNVGISAAVHALPGDHPYARLPLQFAKSLGLSSELIADFESVVESTAYLTFAVTQVWGTKP